MKQAYDGYAGRILRVDLSKGKVVALPLREKLVKGYIGGTGFCARILWDETGPDTDPLGPENRLVFAVGPLTGTAWPTSGRFNVAARSPLTEIWGEANAGGDWGPELKYAGYDAIIVRGKAKKPTYLWIDDDNVELGDASPLWGKTTWETEETIREDLGDRDVKVASIGQAGENLVRFACIINASHRAAGRVGMGTVMGSKGLKAVAVRGSKDVRVADPERFFELIDDVNERIKKDPFAPNTTKYGTTMLVEAMSEIGRFPTKNFQTGVFPMADKIGGNVLVERYKVKDHACFSCPIACKNHLMIRSGPYAGSHGSHPEYETINALGGRCWNDDIENIIHAGWLCNQYGLDTISTGSAIAFAMELWERGIINEKDTGGIDLSWGNKEAIIEMVQNIARREGFGDVFAEGIRRAAEKIGRGAEKYAIHVKGLDISAQDGRAQKSMAIAHATSVRGADHLRHCSFYDEIGFPDAIVERFGEQYLPEMADRLSIRYKGILAKGCEDFAAIVDSLLMCIGGTTFWPPIVWWDDAAKVYTAVTGIEATVTVLKKAAERIVNLKRAYNIRLGLTREHDTLPERFLREPAPDGPCKGHVVELKPMLDEYYRERGWDLETGLIPRSKLKELGLKDVANQLEASGKLPKGE